MKFFSRWSRKKENLEKREEQRKMAREKTESPAAVVPVGQTAETAAGGGVKTKRRGAAYRWLLKPCVTEKSTYLQSDGQYCFVVRPAANKIEVKRAVEETYGVHVKDVRLMNYQGKRVRYGRVTGRRNNWKKAIVCLKKGERIEIHKNV